MIWNKLFRIAVLCAACWGVLQPARAEAVTNDDAFSFEHLEKLEQQAKATVSGHFGSNMVENATSGVVVNASAEEMPSDGEKLVDSLKGQDRSLGMWRSLGALLIVLGGLFMVSKWVQGRLPNRIGGSGNSRMKILERLTIDHKRQLVLISAGERELVVAVSPNQIDAISEWPAQRKADEDADETVSQDGETSEVKS